MQKNTLHLLATMCTLLTFALCLRPSVAELRAAASTSASAIQTPMIAARAITGPRRHNLRVRNVEQSSESSVTEEPVMQTSQQEVKPYLVLHAPVQKSHLDTLLDQSGVNNHQRPLAAAVLGLLAPQCLDQLQTFSVLYDHPAHRGLAGRGVIIVSGVKTDGTDAAIPDDEFIGLLMHEGLGHFRDITCLTGNPASGPSAFHDGPAQIWNDDASVSFYSISWLNERTRKSAARPADFVTGYSYQADNFEDLAESVTYYLTQEDAFRQRAQTNPILAAKLAWLTTYMPKNGPVAVGNPWDGTIAWDATKLSFRWADQSQVAAVR